MCSIHCGVSGLLLFSATNKIHFNLTAKCSKIRNDMLNLPLAVIVKRQSVLHKRDTHKSATPCF